VTEPGRCPACGAFRDSLGTMWNAEHKCVMDCEDSFHDTPARMPDGEGPMTGIPSASEPVIDVDAALARRKAERASEPTPSEVTGPYNYRERAAFAHGQRDARAESDARVAEAVREEREACARECESFAGERGALSTWPHYLKCADAIRARGDDDNR